MGKKNSNKNFLKSIKKSKIIIVIIIVLLVLFFFSNLNDKDHVAKMFGLDCWNDCPTHKDETNVNNSINI